MAYGKERERIEAWPKKGTKAKLQRKADKKRGPDGRTYTLAAFIARVLEEAAE